MPLTFGADIKEGKVYRSKKRQDGDEEKQALKELQTLLNQKNRRSCGCDAQVHDLVENCLKCGRLTCTAEGSGKCFSCGNLILSQDQRYRLTQYIDISQHAPTAGHSPKASNNDGARTKIIDNQFDHFSIDNKRHLRDGERQRLRDNLDDLQTKRNKRELVLEVNIDNLHAGSRSTAKIKDYESELRRLEINDNYNDMHSGQTLMELVAKEYQCETSGLQYIGPDLIVKPSQPKKSTKNSGPMPKKFSNENKSQVGNNQSGQNQQKGRPPMQIGQKQQAKRDNNKKSSGNSNHEKGKPTGPWTNNKNNHK